MPCRYKYWGSLWLSLVLCLMGLGIGEIRTQDISPPLIQSTVERVLPATTPGFLSVAPTSAPSLEVSSSVAQASTVDTAPTIRMTVMGTPTSEVKGVSVPATTSPDVIPEPPVLAGAPILMIGVGLVVGMIGLFLFWRPRVTPQREPVASTDSTLHSQPTSETPRIPFNAPLNLSAVTPISDKRRAVQMHSAVPVDAGFGEAQFRQLPAQLVFKNGPQSGQVFEIDSSYFTIGRHSTSQLRVQDGTVSREHARILFDNAQNLYLIENVSDAGTQVNGQSVTQRRPLSSGDLIQVGNIQIHFQLRLPS